MFNKTFFRFALGFMAILLVGMAGIMVSSRFTEEGGDQSASVVR